MRAVWYEKQGPADEVLIIGEKPTPEPGLGEVLIRVHASGVNPSDEGMRSGLGRSQNVDPFVIPQSDGAGIIEALGEGVTRHAVGDRVWLYNGQREGRQHGTGAEFISLNAERVRPLPDDLRFSEGAALGIPCMTAHFSVFSNGPVDGKTVLVPGGAGAVGNYVIQWAKWGGAKVISTISSGDKAADAKTAGADVTINYREENVAERVLAETGGEGVDLICEVDFGGNIAITEQVTKVNGCVSIYASKGELNPVVPMNVFMTKNIKVWPFVLPMTPLPDCERAQADIATWLGEAKRFHRVAGEFPLAETAAAHELVASKTK
ncbi:MAG: NADPH:quinone reductase, partial [Alphaproteobacteria bacterium]|nr:NADPH:quinone reductase [Alphaproteobacteria bacterium]